MDSIYWPAVFWGVVVGTVVYLGTAIVLELRNNRRGERGDFDVELRDVVADAQTADETEWAEFESWLQTQ